MSVPPLPIGGLKLFCAVISNVYNTPSLWTSLTVLAAALNWRLQERSFTVPVDDRFLYSLDFKPHHIPQISG